MTDHTPCKACGRPIRFIVTDEGASVPIDPSAPCYAVVIDPATGAEFWSRNRNAYANHFSTCRGNVARFSGRNRNSERSRRPGGPT